MDKSSLHPLLEAEFAGHNGLVAGRLGEKPMLSIRLARAPSSRPPVSEAGACFARRFLHGPGSGTPSDLQVKTAKKKPLCLALLSAPNYSFMVL